MILALALSDWLTIVAAFLDNQATTTTQNSIRYRQRLLVFVWKWIQPSLVRTLLSTLPDLQGTHVYQFLVYVDGPPPLHQCMYVCVYIHQCPYISFFSSRPLIPKRTKGIHPSSIIHRSFALPASCCSPWLAQVSVCLHALLPA